jgi:putative cardiolipin synthase
MKHIFQVLETMLKKIHRPNFVLLLSATIAMLVIASCATLPEGFDRPESYFVPGKPGTAFLTDLSRRGVRVRILTNSLASTDVDIVHAGYKKYRRKLLKSGVELYELNKKLTRRQRKDKKGTGGSSKVGLHAKSFVFDRKQVFIGSLNLDPRSKLHNTEIGVVIKAPEIAEEMAIRFEENIEQLAFRLELKQDENGHQRLLWHGLEKGRQVVYTHEPHTGFWRRFGINFMSMWPIESQL